jgi:putative hemolysin
METCTQGSGPFSFAGASSGNAVRDGLLRLLKPTLEKMLAFEQLNSIYADTRARQKGRPFVEAALESLDVETVVDPAQLATVPATGPLVVVANHPFGGLEGMILEAVLRRVRPDVKLLANYMLHMIPDMRDSLIPVDPFDRPESVRRNAASIRQAVRWVRDGHVLGIFPAGEVSHSTLRCPSVVDPPWNQTAGRIITMAGAAALPVYFDGQNSLKFQLLGLLHPRFRTVMLPRELLRRKHTRVPVSIGGLVGTDRIARFADAAELTEYLRVRTYILRNRVGPKASDKPAKPRPAAAAAVPIAEAQSRAALLAEVQSLPAEQLLLASGRFNVYSFRSHQSPAMMHEIGRQREIAFRAVGEGTGKSLDLDEFDEYYIHLIVWNAEANELVGAYRAGATDEILPRHGIGGLYTSTLFQYKPALLKQISPALELGRSFVAPQYQQGYSPLMLLWKGIARYLYLNPRYRRFFGPVSISNEYQSMSRQLLVEFLRQNRRLPELSQLVSPRNPLRMRPIHEWGAKATSIAVRDLEGVDEFIAQIEGASAAAPVLLRQYLKLNARLLAVNVDADFADAIDALMLVDATEMDRAALVRYMGRDEAQQYLQHHGKSLRQPQEACAAT